MPIYSHSRLSSFEQCPQKFKFKYIDKLKVEVEESIEGFLGNQVHNALEYLYKQTKMNIVPTIQQLLEFYEDTWKKNLPEKINIVKKEYSANDYFKRGITFLENYYKKHHPFKENTIATEKRIMMDLDGTGKYRMQGYIDRLVFNEETQQYEIHDYKTNNSLKTQQELDEDRQLALYSIAIKDMYKDAKDVCLTWHFLAHDKKFCSFRTDEQLEQLKQEIIQLIDKIESNTEWPANESMLCNWCEFQPHCPRFKDNYPEKPDQQKTLDMSDNSEDTTKLVDKYAELQEKKKQITEEIDSEIELIRQAIITYAKASNIEVLFGTDNKLTIKNYNKYSFPKKSTDQRQELNNLIKSINKWNEVSALDTFAMDKILKEKTWPKEVLDKIEQFAEKQELQRLSLRKKNQNLNER